MVAAPKLRPRIRQVVGDEPRRLSSAPPVDRLLPKTQEEAEQIGQSEHPVARAALHDVNAAEHDVWVAEGDFMPSLSMVDNA
jgi:outer membrane protein